MPVRDPRPIPQGSPADVHSATLAKPRKHLDALRLHHVGLARRCFEAADGALYEIDMVISAALARSYSLVDGFISAFDSWNPIVAAPLLRMQIDSLVRLSYMATAPNAELVAGHVVRGGEFRSLKDEDQQKLTDRRLVEHAGKIHPWISAVYEKTSGWVHFSPAHLYAVWKLADDEPDGSVGKIEGAVPIRPEQIPLSALEELVGAMNEATEGVFGYAEMWEQRKGLPLGQVRPSRGRHSADDSAS